MDLNICRVTAVRFLQSQLYAALRRTKLIPNDTGWQELGYSRCGRTDKGVSALGQVSPLMAMLQSMAPGKEA